MKEFLQDVAACVAAIFLVWACFVVIMAGGPM